MSGAHGARVYESDGAVMDAAAVATALQWSKRTGKFAGAEANFKELVNVLATATVDPRRVEPVEAEILGIGAFGMIERAMLDGKPVAVKSLKAEVMDGRKALSQIMVSRIVHTLECVCGQLVSTCRCADACATYLCAQHEFALELKVNVKIRHPHIVGFLGAVARFPKAQQPVNDWSLGLILELCDGGELNNLMHARKVKFSMREKLQFAADTAKGVAYLASQNVIHRDLSTRNLLLTGSGRVKIADYGCARILPGGRSYQPSFISGSPPWVQPPQIPLYTHARADRQTD